MQNITKEPNSVNNVGGVMGFVFCIPYDDGLYLYQVSQKYLKGFQNYGIDTKIY